MGLSILLIYIANYSLFRCGTYFLDNYRNHAVNSSRLMTSDDKIDSLLFTAPTQVEINIVKS